MKPAMNRRMRTRMSGGVGRAGEKPALTRLDTANLDVLFATAQLLFFKFNNICMNVQGCFCEQE